MASRRKHKKKNIELAMIENHVEAIKMNRIFNIEKKREIMFRKFSETAMEIEARIRRKTIDRYGILFKKFYL